MAHPLRREIIATVVANSVVNRAGISFLSRLADELGIGLPELTRAHVIARDVFGAAATWTAIDELDFVVSAEVQTRMFLAVRRLVERGARWFVRHRTELPIGPTIAEFGVAVAGVLAALPELLEAEAATTFRVAADELVTAGVPGELARTVAGCEMALGALTVADVAHESSLDPGVVARVHFTLGDRLGLVWLRARVADLSRADRWQTEARAALRDDLADCHRALTEAACRASAASSPSGTDAWLTAHAEEVSRYRHILDEIRAGGAYGLAQLTAARRALRDLSDAVGRDRRPT